MSVDEGTGLTNVTRLPVIERRIALSYFGALVLAFEFAAPNGGLIGIPLSFFLKNKLHLAAHDLANFMFWTNVPLYLSFVFGLARDNWSPFGLGDRGYFSTFGLLTACLFVGFAFIPVSEPTLLIGILVVTTSYLFLWSAWNGLASSLANHHAMSGQVSAVRNILSSLPTVLAILAGGVLSEQLEGQGANEAFRTLFLVGASIMLLVAVFGFLKPRAIYSNVPTLRRGAADFPRKLARIVKHWPIYPALVIWLLWNFAPGMQTVLQYYLTNTLKMSDSQFGTFNAIYFAAYMPTILLFGFLCQRYSLKKLLWWATAIGIPQMIPLLTVHSVHGAYFSAALIGLMGGMATASYMALLIRSCPDGIEGTMMMLASSMLFLALRFGDLLGTDIYDHYGGFLVSVVVTTAVYLLIVPALLLIPTRLIDTADGQMPTEPTIN